MINSISPLDLDEPANELHKAKAILDLMIDTQPAGETTPEGWRELAVYDFIHLALVELKRLQEEALAGRTA